MSVPGSPRLPRVFRALAEYSVARQRRVLAAGLDWARYERLMISPEEFMRDLLAHLDGQYGGVEPYLRSIGVDGEQLATLRANLTE